MKFSSFSLVMLIIMLPCLALMAGMLINETKPKKNIVLGVTLPVSVQTDPEVLALCAQLKRRLLVCCAVLIALALPMLFVRHSSVAMTLLLIWLIPVIAAPMVVYGVSNTKLKRLKKSRGWVPRHERQTVLDLEFSVRQRKPLSRWLFVPPFVLCLIPGVSAALSVEGWARTEGLVLSGSFALVALLGLIFYPLIFRQKPDVAADDSRVNMALTNVRRYNWGKTWIVLSWASAAYCLGCWYLIESNTAFVLLTVAYTAVIMALCVSAEFGTRRAHEEISAKYAREVFVDEDEHWIYGLFYHNPNDRHFMINARVGINMGVNLAHRAGKVMMFLTALLILCMPLIGVWMMRLEFSPRVAEVGGGELTLVQSKERFSLELEGITGMELIEELPAARRSVGIGMDSLFEGRFNVEGYGACYVCLNPQEGPFIVLETAEDTYIFNLAEGDLTRSLYQDIRSAKNA